MQRGCFQATQMMVTALTETCDYNKPHDVCCKRARGWRENIFPAPGKQH
jgi:hypothetical protein